MLELTVQALTLGDAALHCAERCRHPNNNCTSVCGILLKHCNMLCVHAHIKKKKTETKQNAPKVSEVNVKLALCYRWRNRVGSA